MSAFALQWMFLFPVWEGPTAKKTVTQSHHKKSHIPDAPCMPYLPISWGGLGVNVGKYGSPISRVWAKSLFAAEHLPTLPSSPRGVPNPVANLGHSANPPQTGSAPRRGSSAQGAWSSIAVGPWNDAEGAERRSAEAPQPEARREKAHAGEGGLWVRLGEVRLE